MYPIEADKLQLFKESYRQIVEINFNGVDESTVLTERDIIAGGLSVNRYCVSGKNIEIGSAIASELTVTLDNSDGRFNDIKFEGAELYVKVGTKKWDAYRWENAKNYYVPFGYFTVDEVPRKTKRITLSALDRMVLFDKTVDRSKLTFPITVAALLRKICQVCNVHLKTDPETLTNSTLSIPKPFESADLTYRQLLSWIAEITGTCAFIDWEGKLVLKWYEETGEVLNLSDRFDSDLHENEIKLSGIVITDENEEHTSGTTDYALKISGNELIQAEHETVADNLYVKLNGFTYTPFSASLKPMPHLYPLDIVTYVDKDNKTHKTIITNYTFTINKNTSVEGNGETQTQKGYAESNPLTAKEKGIIKKLQEETNSELNNRVQTVLAFNELINSSMGFYYTSVQNSDGTTKFYLHDKPALVDSKTIYTRNLNGYAYTNDGWKGDQTVWTSGVDKDGNAIFNKVSAYGLEVSNQTTGYVTKINPETFEIEKDSETLLKLGNNGLNVYDGGITLYKGKGTSAEKILYFDNAKNMVKFAGALSHPDSKTSMRVGKSTNGNEGVYLYVESATFERPDGSGYKPFLECAYNHGGGTDINAVLGLRINCGTISPDGTADESFRSVMTVFLDRVTILEPCRMFDDLYVAPTGVSDADSTLKVEGNIGTLNGTWYGSLNTSSDRRKKSKIKKLGNRFSEFFSKLNPVSFTYKKEKNGKAHLGFIAQDVEKALKQSDLSCDDFAGLVIDKKGEYSLNYSEFIPVLTAEIQKLQAENKELKSRLSKVEKALEERN